MRQKPLRVFADANILFPVHLRDLFIELDRAGAIVTLWSPDVQEEWARNALEEHEKKRMKHPELQLPEWTRDGLDRQNRFMDLMLPHAKVTGYESAVDSVVGLNDLDDRHVVAAAAHGYADVLISADRDAGFADVLAGYGIDLYEADLFLVFLMSQDVGMVRRVIRAVKKQRKDYRKPPMTADELLTKYQRNGLTRFAAVLAAFRNKI